MTPQSVDLVGCSASNFAGSAKRWHPWAEFLDHMGMRPAAPAGRRGNGAHLTLPRHAVPRGRACPLLSFSTSAPASLGMDKWRVDEVLREEPRLEFARADEVRDNQVVRAVVTERGDPACRLVRVAEDHLVRLKQPGEHRRHLLAPVRGPRYRREFRDVPRVADRNPPE